MRSHTWNRRVPLVLLVLSVGLNIGLSRRIVALQAPPQRSLQPGVRVPDFEVRSLTGEVVRISYDSQLPTLLYYFSPACTWCNRNWDNIRALQQASAQRFRLVGLSPTDKGVDKILRENNVAFEVYTGMSPEMTRTYHLSGTPETVLVSNIGTVLKAWPGAYGPALSIEMANYFGIKLPGLTPVGQN